MKHDVESYNPNIDVGLTSDQVNERVKKGLLNKNDGLYHKSLKEILLSDVFSLFNICCFVFAIFLVICQLYEYLLFVIFVLINTLIQLFSELRIRKQNRINNVNDEEIIVLRDGIESFVSVYDIVLNDIIVIKQSSIIPVDGEVVFGQVSVNESSLNGNSGNIHKTTGDKVYANTIATNGYAKILVTSVEKKYREVYKIKRPKPQSFATIEFILKILITVVLAISSFKIIVSNGQNKIDNLQSVGHVVGYLMCAIPAGLLVLMSITQLISASRLNKKGIVVNNPKAIEMLTRSDVICVDKTGTITDASMKVKTIEPLNSMSEDQISQILSNVLNATRDTTSTAKAIRKYLKFEPTAAATAALPFIAENKYSGASFGTRGTYILGALDNLNITNKAGLSYRAEEYIEKGYYVLLLGHSYEVINGSKFEKTIDPVAFIILEDNVKNEIIDTLKYVREMGVDIKVISGDDAQTVSELAKSVGILNADKYVSLKDKSDEEVEALALDFVVFGEASINQKEIIINALKRNKKTVTMIGDGINDIYALRSADCSIAMGNGNSEAKNISDMVLLDSDITKLPHIVNEGNVLIRSLEKMAPLFIAKSFVIFIAYLFFIFASIVEKEAVYPLVLRHLYIYEFICVIFTSIVLITHNTQNNFNKKSFIRNILIKIIPATLIQTFLIVLYFVLYQCRVNEITYLEISLIPYTGELAIYQGCTIGMMQIIAMTEISLIVFGLVFAFDMFRPMNKKSVVEFVLVALVAAVITGLEIYLSYAKLNEKVFLLTGFNYVTTYQWVLVGFVLIIVSAVYLFVTKIVEYINDRIKESKEEVKESDEN